MISLSLIYEADSGRAGTWLLATVDLLPGASSVSLPLINSRGPDPTIDLCSEPLV